MDVAGPAGGLEFPRHAPLDREIELEGGGPVSIAAVGARDPGGQPLRSDLRHGPRRQVEEDGIGRRQLAERAHRAAGLDRAAVLPHDRGQRLDDRSRAAARNRPAEAVAGAGQCHPHR
jgi:hypothetical protein